MKKAILTSVLSLVLISPCRHSEPEPKFDPRDTNQDGYVDCKEDPNPDPVTDIPCGFRDGVPVGE